MEDLETAIGKATGKASNYVLNCDVKKVKVPVHTLQKNKELGSSYKDEILILVPDHGTTSFARFMAAYYQDFDDNVLPNGEEFIAMIAYPVGKYARLAFDYETEYEPYFSFMVMSEEVEEILSHKVGESIQIEIMPENFENDSEMDI